MCVCVCVCVCVFVYLCACVCVCMCVHVLINEHSVEKLNLFKYPCEWNVPFNILIVRVRSVPFNVSRIILRHLLQKQFRKAQFDRNVYIYKLCNPSFAMRCNMFKSVPEHIHLYFYCYDKDLFIVLFDFD